MSGLIFGAFAANAGDADVWLYTGQENSSGQPIATDITLGDGPLGLNTGSNIDANDGGPLLFGFNDSIYFDGNVNGVEELFVYNQTSSVLTEIQPPTAQAGNGLWPEDFTAYDDFVYFMGRTANTNTYFLWTTNGTAAGTTPVGPPVVASPVVNGSLAVYDPKGSGIGGFGDNNLYFNGVGVHGVNSSTDDLFAYNSLGGAFTDISFGAAGVSKAGLNPLNAVAALSDGFLENTTDDLFMAGRNAKGKEDLFMYNGSSLVDIKGGDSITGITPWDITPVSTTETIGSTTFSVAGVYFSGLNSQGERGLYFANGQETLSSGAPGDFVAAGAGFGGAPGGLDPGDIVSLNGMVYFTGNDNYAVHGGEDSRGLFEYDPITQKTKELIKSSTLNLTAGYNEQSSSISDPTYGSTNPPTMAVFNGELFFTALNPNASGAASVDQIYEYSGSGAAPTKFFGAGPNPNQDLSTNGSPSSLFSF
jgi:hypothetical protein